MSEETKALTPAQEKKKALFYEKKNGYDRISAADRADIRYLAKLPLFNADGTVK